MQHQNGKSASHWQLNPERHLGHIIVCAQALNGEVLLAAPKFQSLDAAHEEAEAAAAPAPEPEASEVRPVQSLHVATSNRLGWDPDILNKHPTNCLKCGPKAGC